MYFTSFHEACWDKQDIFVNTCCSKTKFHVKDRETTLGLVLLRHSCYQVRVVEKVKLLLW